MFYLIMEPWKKIILHSLSLNKKVNPEIMKLGKEILQSCRIIKKIDDF